MTTPDDLPRAADVVVVGAGVVGAATASALAARGARVVVLDKEPGPAREGSGRAQGSLRVQGRHPAELPLAVEALRLWRQAVAEDPDAADAELETRGNVYLATRADEPDRLRALAEQARAVGLDAVRWVGADEVRALLPAATGPVLGAMVSPYDAQAQPDAATRVWVRRAARLGARFVYGSKVTAVRTAGGRVTGVRTADADVEADRVVVAAGAWAAHLLAGAGVRLPLMPVVLSEVETAPLPPLLGPTVRAAGFGARQRPDGRLVVSAGLGARVTRRASLADLHGLRFWLPRAAAFRAHLQLRVDGRQVLRELRRGRALDPALVPDMSPEPFCDRASLDAALRALAEVFPAAAGAVTQRSWGGVVDLSPDGLPVVDGRCGADGLVVVAGLNGHGLAVAPALGEAAADLTLDRPPGHDLSPFALARFAGRVPSPEVMI
ncbi:FAD-binding oxidoreductase [Kineosporia sp. R_H_3]|uniref:NAD(P)/FAD-dependent oxidoreductase n=1 Tax=Kineosporia sp. R_H_3 TaxID=1961848 RepID=UPI000B4BCAC8|nr:FAD-dependent oxidoreductase [Kineosporia sp. R_H_3]